MGCRTAVEAPTQSLKDPFTNLRPGYPCHIIICATCIRWYQFNLTQVRKTSWTEREREREKERDTPRERGREMKRDGELEKKRGRKKEQKIDRSVD